MDWSQVLNNMEMYNAPATKARFATGKPNPSARESTKKASDEMAKQPIARGL